MLFCNNLPKNNNCFIAFIQIKSSTKKTIEFRDITLYNVITRRNNTNPGGYDMIRVLGLGDNVVDKYMHIRTMYPGGNALNIAVFAKLMGMESAYLGVFGDDAAAAHVYRTVSSLGLDVSRCRYEEGENGYAEVTLQDGDRVFVGSNKGGVSKAVPLKLTDLDKDYISGFDLCHTSVYSYIEEELPKIRRADTFVSMDFSDRLDEDYFRKCCPYVDCAEISCGDMPEKEIMEKIELIRKCGCRHIVIATRGSKGAVAAVDGKIYEQSPCLIKAVDTMGAGDSFITSFLVNYLDGMKNVADFPENAGDKGITTIDEYKDQLIRVCLYRAAVFSSEQCLRDGSFGYGKVF